MLLDINTDINVLLDIILLKLYIDKFPLKKKKKMLFKSIWVFRNKLTFMFSIYVKRVFIFYDLFKIERFCASNVFI